LVGGQRDGLGVAGVVAAPAEGGLGGRAGGAGERREQGAEGQQSVAQPGCPGLLDHGSSRGGCESDRAAAPAVTPTGSRTGAAPAVAPPRPRTAARSAGRTRPERGRTPKGKRLDVRAADYSAAGRGVKRNRGPAPPAARRRQAPGRWRQGGQGAWLLLVLQLLRLATLLLLVQLGRGVRLPQLVLTRAEGLLRLRAGLERPFLHLPGQLLHQGPVGGQGFVDIFDLFCICLRLVRLQFLHLDLL